MRMDSKNTASHKQIAIIMVFSACSTKLRSIRTSISQLIISDQDTSVARTVQIAFTTESMIRLLK